MLRGRPSCVLSAEIEPTTRGLPDRWGSISPFVQQEVRVFGEYKIFADALLVAVLVDRHAQTSSGYLIHIMFAVPVRVVIVVRSMELRMFSKPNQFGAVFIALLASVTNGLIAEACAEGSVREGAQLIQKLCATCHVTADTSSASVPTGPPTLRGIANRFDQSAERITGVLIQPHAPMPEVQLTRLEIEHIIAYLQSLREPDLPPLKGFQPNAPAEPRKLAPASVPFIVAPNRNGASATLTGSYCLWTSPAKT